MGPSFLVPYASPFVLVFVLYAVASTEAVLGPSLSAR